MKRRNREINIFSMSALDLFASALGAFILIAIVIFPHFPNIGMAELNALEAALDRLRSEEENSAALQAIRNELEERLQRVQAVYESQVAELRQQVTDTTEALAQAVQERNAAQGQLAESLADNEVLEANLADERRREFLFITISWSTDDDVDLHVVDPRGNEYAWNSRRHPGSPARFEEDTVNGPGNEVWLHPTVEPGQYEIYYNLYSGDDTPVVRGAAIYSRGREELQNVTLTLGPRRHIATVAVETQAGGGLAVSVR